ncbi:hypothetical protein GCM10020255_075120 [Rhodococcus baikonurensis]
MTTIAISRNPSAFSETTESIAALSKDKTALLVDPAEVGADEEGDAESVADEQAERNNAVAMPATATLRTLASCRAVDFRKSS